MLGRFRVGRSLLAAALWLSPLPASGTELEDQLMGVIAVGGLFVAADLGFTTYDVVQAARGAPPARGAAVAEVLVATPQAVAGIGLGALALGSDDRSALGVALPLALAAWTTALAVHGTAALAADSERARAGDRLFEAGVFAAAAANGAATIYDLGSLAVGTRPPRAWGAVELFLGASQLPVWAYAGIAGEELRAGSVAFLGWSAVVAAHGAWVLATSPSWTTSADAARRAAPRFTLSPLVPDLQGSSSATGLAIRGRT